MKVDLTGKVKFQTQFDAIFGDKQKQNVACCRASKKMITDTGFKTVDAVGRIDMLVKDANLNLVKSKTFNEALTCLNANLDAGRPVLVGVNRGKLAVGNANKATTHFVVVVGREEINGSTQYRFYDPGTSYSAKGCHSTNLFRFDAVGFLSGKSFYNADRCTYIITEVRPTGL
jgi:hypothetical protein